MRIIGVGMTLGAALMAFQMNIDLAAMQKWSDAKVIRYHIVGTHEARLNLADNTNADVTDRIILDFDWDMKTRKPIGDIKITNEKSQLKNTAADNTKCGPPAIKGVYEHLDVTKAIAESGGSIELKGIRSTPPIDDPQWPASCSPRTVPSKVVEVSEFLGLAEPQILALPASVSQKGLKIAADKKSYTLSASNHWTWAITPTVTQ